MNALLAGSSREKRRRRVRLLSLVVAMYERKGFHCLNKALAVRDRPVRRL